MVHPGVDAVHRPLQHVADAGQSPIPLLSRIEKILSSAGRAFPAGRRFVVGVAQDVGAGVDQRPLRRLVLDDLGVILGAAAWGTLRPTS